MEDLPPVTRPFVVVLTGGPNAGKTSAVAILRTRLSARGFQVFTVPKNATHFLANTDGLQDEGIGEVEQVSMQRIFLDYQIHQEDAFKAFAALHSRKRAVILLDGCTLNGKVFSSDEQWKQTLTMPGKEKLSDDDLLQRYDLVVHMMTCAFSQATQGHGSSDAVRFQHVEHAKECDKRCLDVFSSHPQLRVVPHFESLDEKIQKVLDFVNDGLHVEGLAGKRHRTAVRAARFERLLAVARLPTTSSFVVTSTFLDEEMNHSVRRRAKVPVRLWLERFRRWQAPPGLASAILPHHVARASPPLPNTDISFERRASVPSPMDSSQRYLTRKIIHEDDYAVAIESAVLRPLDDSKSGGGCASRTVGRGRITATKYVLSFVALGHYYELFLFGSDQKRLLLDHSEGAPMPLWLEHVTGPSEVDLASAESTEAVTSPSSRLMQPSTREEGVATASGSAPASLELTAMRSLTLPSPLGTMSPPAKRRRILGRYTTEEAALVNPDPPALAVGSSLSVSSSATRVSAAPVLVA
eukprot:TRINITY_DN42028_c0_g1_i1.p1 TRINITY_DN42028_c0_g1~~TRINITY_DN42028_c0_g1_i1.p1  ORF type:complete len:544 (-),score=83.85 TRINITY_DN42028_c0_g1_i1:454-2028(-)